MKSKPSYTNPKIKTIQLQPTGSYVRVENDGHSVVVRVHNGYDTMTLDLSYYSPADKTKSLAALHKLTEALDMAWNEVNDATPPKLEYDKRQKEAKASGKFKDSGILSALDEA